MWFFFRPSRFERDTLAALGRIERRQAVMGTEQEEILALANQINDQTNTLAAIEEQDHQELVDANGRLQAIIDQIGSGQTPTLDGIKAALMGVTGTLSTASARAASNAATLHSWGQDPADPFPGTPPAPPTEATPTL